MILQRTRTSFKVLPQPLCLVGRTLFDDVLMCECQNSELAQVLKVAQSLAIVHGHCKHCQRNGQSGTAVQCQSIFGVLPAKINKERCCQVLTAAMPGLG
jgi:hypothetical protein